MLDKLVQELINGARRDQDRDKPVPLVAFRVERLARDLIEPSWAKANHHRDREKYYTGELETAEKDLREKGISVEAYDQIGQLSQQNYENVFSGNITGPQVTFAPKIDQTMLDKVKRAKEKMLEHRGDAKGYERYARAFACAPNAKLELTVSEVDYFGLEGTSIR